jgi:hypothetical protein
VRVKIAARDVSKIPEIVEGAILPFFCMISHMKKFLLFYFLKKSNLNS